MDWKYGSQNHRNLSDIEANNYDENYANKNSNVATVEHMKLEEGFLKEVVAKLGKKNTVLDIGCGTGRHMLNFAPVFENCFGVDFSPKMVEAVVQKLSEQKISNVSLKLCDINTEDFESITEKKLSFINASFGMGSFIENIDGFLKKAGDLLDENGQIYMSFYNKDSVFCDESISGDVDLSAIPATKDQELIVDGVNIPCIYYSPEELSKIFKNHGFEKKSLMTHLNTLPCLKKSIQNNPEARKYFARIDQKLFEQGDETGYYIMCLFEKGGQ